MINSPIDPGALRALVSFEAVARHGSFSRASVELAITRSALSHRIRALEEKLDVRLLNRTTRSVSPTSAGERLLTQIKPALDTLARSVQEVVDAAEEPAGRLRLNVSNLAARVALAPRLGALRSTYPGIELDVSVSDAFVDIVSGGFDAGIRFHEALHLDMVSIPIGPEIEFAVVAAPDYLRGRVLPTHPSDLLEHDCIGFRLISSGRLYAWEFERDGDALSMTLGARFACDSTSIMVRAALHGLGLAYVSLDEVETHLRTGRLVRVLEPWCESAGRLRLYYPERKRTPHTLRALISILR
ncbi:MAG: LysR family transcriptional regulator [Myxococcota bacterium]